MIEALQDSRRDSSCDELWNDSEDAGKSSGAAETMAQTGRRPAGRRLQVTSFQGPASSSRRFSPRPEPRDAHTNTSGRRPLRKSSKLLHKFLLVEESRRGKTLRLSVNVLNKIQLPGF